MTPIDVFIEAVTSIPAARWLLWLGLWIGIGWLFLSALGLLSFIETLRARRERAFYVELRRLIDGHPDE